MDFTLPASLEDYRRRYREFVRATVLPLDTDPRSFDEHQNIRAEVWPACARRRRRPACGRRRCRRIAAARPSRRRHGRVLRGAQLLALRPVSVNCARRRREHDPAEQVGTPAQKERWLQPSWTGRCAPRSP